MDTIKHLANQQKELKRVNNEVSFKLAAKNEDLVPLRNFEIIRDDNDQLRSNLGFYQM